MQLNDGYWTYAFGAHRGTPGHLRGTPPHFPRRNIMGTQNHFANVAEQIQKAPQNQRTEALISGIAQQMQSSNDQNTQQLGAELQNDKGQMVKACQPT